MSRLGAFFRGPPRAVWLGASLAGWLALFAPVRPAHAQDGARDEPRDQAPAPVTPPRDGVADLEPRPVPDYDGLPEPGVRPEDVLLALPRLVLAPVHLVLEYVVRRPLGELVTLVEREGWYDAIADAVTWDERRAGILPVAFYDFGQLPSIGLYFFWNDLGAPGHQVRVHAATGGWDWLHASVLDRVRLRPDLELAVRGEVWRRPDQIFQGLGPRSRADDRARYRRDQVDGTVTLSARFWRRSSLLVAVGVTANSFDANGYEPTQGEPSLAAAIGNGTIGELPPGFDGYAAYRQRLRVTVDTREDLARAGSGARVDVMGEQGAELAGQPARRWVRYGVALAGFVETLPERVFSLHLRTVFVDPTGDAPVPFTEQAQLGGGMLDMPGFLPGALIDRSSVVATLRYRWPIWALLDASLFASTGNVFGEHLEGFALERLRMSYGIGVQTLGDRDQSLRIGFALGTRPFELGGDPESVRLYLGGAMGF